MLRISFAVCLASVSIVLAGCSVPVQPPEGAAVEATADSVPTEVTCSQLGDVYTIVQNTRNAFDAGRLLQQEIDGAGRLATRILGAVDVEPGTDLAESVAAAQQFAPKLETYSVDAPPDFTSQEWYLLSEDLSRTCSEAGTPITVAGWVGG